MGVQRQREMEQLGTGTRMGVSKHASNSAILFVVDDKTKQEGSSSESEICSNETGMVPYFLFNLTVHGRGVGDKDDRQIIILVLAGIAFGIGINNM